MCAVIKVCLYLQTAGQLVRSGLSSFLKALLIKTKKGFRRQPTLSAYTSNREGEKRETMERKGENPYLSIKMLIHLNDLPIQVPLVLFALFVLIPHFTSHTDS